jgi:hypothetical protein
MVARLLSRGGALCQAFRFDGEEDSRLSCVNLPPPIIKRPDPAIYDQEREVADGRIPTWDSPDILTHNVPPLVPLSAIQADVRNLSAEATALNTLVQFAWARFGIGFPLEAIGATTVTLARRGFPGDHVRTAISVPAAASAQVRFAVSVRLSHPHDADTTNNEGAQALDLRSVSQVGRTPVFDIPLFNSTTQVLDVDLAANPIDWDIDIRPSSVSLNPGQQQVVDVHFNIPSAVPQGTMRTFDITATTSDGLFGGVALMVNVDG